MNPTNTMNKLFQTRVGTIVSAYQTKCFSGQRDIGGSVATNSGRIVLAVGASDTWQEIPFTIAVSDDRGRNFDKQFVMPVYHDVTYHTVGMLYDNRKDVLMALFGETKGYKLFKKRNTWGESRTFSAKDHFVPSKLMMARSTDNGKTWKLFTLYDYRKNNRGHLSCWGIHGCGVQAGDDLFVPQEQQTANEARNAFRTRVPLSRIRNLTRENDSKSFEFENEFRILTTDSDQDIPYSSESAYIRKIDNTGFLSFHRPKEGMPFRREYDSQHNPLSDFLRVQSRGFDPRDYAPGVHGPGIYAFNVVRMLDGNLLMASRFYGTEHHKAGNIFMTSSDEGLTWDYEDDQIPCSLEPFRLYPSGGGGNPSLSYLPDASLIHTTSAGCGEPLFATGGTLVCCFRGFVIEAKKTGVSRGSVSVDTSDLTGIEAVYLANLSIIDKNSIEFENCNPDNSAFAFALTSYSPDRRKIKIDYKVTGPAPFIKLKIVLANKVNNHRPAFEPVIKIPE